MEQVVEFVTTTGFAFESTVVLTSIVTVATFLMIKRTPKNKRMDDFGTSCFEKKVYFVCFRQSKTEDTLKPFEAPVISAYLGFEGEKGLNFQGLKTATNGTRFCITTRNLTDKKLNVSTNELKIAASSLLANEKKNDNVYSNFEPQCFSDIMAHYRRATCRVLS